MSRFNYENIPKEMISCKNWVCWGGGKLPKNAYTGGNAQSNNPSTWSDYDTAIKAITKYNFEGIGFMFSQPYFGVDLDKCIDNVDFVDEFVDTLQSYSEYSKSGNGIHIICRGELPGTERRKGNVEMYSDGRFFIMTGNAYRNKQEIRDCSETIRILHSKYLFTPKSTLLPAIYEKLDLSDAEIIDKARTAKNGYAFDNLYRGNWEGAYTSQSEADMAICNMLAFWTQKNYEQMDRMFRSSALYRPKWDENRGGLTYGQKTIERAISSCNECYHAGLKGKEETLVITGGSIKEVKQYKHYEYSDTGNALRFTDKYKGNIKYMFATKQWYFWDGKRWTCDELGEIKRLADDCISDIKKQAFSIQDSDEQKELLKWALKTSNNKNKVNMIAESQHIENIPLSNSDLDKQDDILNCQDGIIKLKNGELIRHDKSYLTSNISYSGYNNRSVNKPERWLKFLDEITNGDKELQLYLQKAVGYSLTGSIKEQCVFFCYGNGNNGKSTFLNVLTDLAGTYCTNIQAETIMIKNNPNVVNQDIARLKGARLVTVPEPQEQVRLNESLVKQMTGGDKITARFLYGREFEFTPIFKLWIGTNHKPIIRGTDDGIWRRIKLIPFTTTIPKDKIDKGLSHKLRSELPLIMKWAVEGCMLWQKEGLESPQCIIAASTIYKQEMDVLSKFVEDCVVSNSNGQIKASDFYQVYCAWAKDNNEFEMTNSRFGREISLRYPEKKRLNDGQYYKNCMLAALGNKYLDESDDHSLPFNSSRKDYRKYET